MCVAGIVAGGAIARALLRPMHRRAGRGISYVRYIHTKRLLHYISTSTTVAASLLC